MHLENLVIYIVLAIITKLSTSAPTDSKISVYNKLQTITKEKCPYLNETPLLDPRLEFFKDCDNYDEALLSKYDNIYSATRALCMVYFDAFTKLCNGPKDLTARMGITPAIKNANKIPLRDVCETIGKYSTRLSEKNTCLEYCKDQSSSLLVCSYSAVMFQVASQTAKFPPNVSGGQHEPMGVQGVNITTNETQNRSLGSNNKKPQSIEVKNINATTLKPNQSNKIQVESSRQQNHSKEIVLPINNSVQIQTTTVTVSLNKTFKGVNDLKAKKEKPAFMRQMDVDDEETTTKGTMTSLPPKEKPKFQNEAPPKGEKQDVQPIRIEEDDDINNNNIDNEKEENLIEAQEQMQMPYRSTFDEQNSASSNESYFFSYFMSGCFVFIIGYVGYHNKQKIMALLLEGRRGKRQQRRRPNSASYHKLDSNLEEAVTSSCTNKGTSNIIY